MNRAFKAFFILALSALAALSVFAFVGCETNGDGGNPNNPIKPNDPVKPDGGKENYVEYTLDSFVYSVTGYEEQYIDLDEMSENDHSTYDAVILTYGKTVSISDKSINFSGAALTAFGNAGYTLDGDSVKFSDETLSATFTYVKLKNGVFSIGFQQIASGMTVRYSFDYYSKDAVPPSYTVTFDSNGGDSVENQTVKKGGKAAKPADPQKQGYTFSGWYTDGDTQWDFENGRVVKDTVLHARYTANINTVSFVTYGDTKNFEDRVESGRCVYPPQDPEKAGHSFVGWYFDCEFETIFDFNEPIYGDITLYAKYKPNEYTVTFDCVSESVTVAFGGKLGELPVPENGEFTFGGWFDQSDGGTQYTAESGYYVDGDLLLYAKWTATITLDNYGLGTLEKTTLEAAYGWRQMSVENLPLLRADNAKFVGWYTERGGNGTAYKDYDTYLFGANVTLYAAWQLTASFDSAGGSEINMKFVVKGDYFLNLETPTKYGYNFEGWYDGEGNRVTEATVIEKTSSFTLAARWTPKNVLFVFDSQGGSSVPNGNYTYGATLGELPAVEKSGNVFGGWYTQIAGGGTKYSESTVCEVEFIRLYAKWTAQISFDYGGATEGTTVENISFVYNGSIDLLLPQPYKTGWSFEGWYTQTDGAGDRLENDRIIKAAGNIQTTWQLVGNTTVYAYWVKGLDKRFINFAESDSAVAVNGLIDTAVTQLEIPAIINLKPVTAIRSKAFYNAPLTSITVPDSVTLIGEKAFAGCPLEELTLPFVGKSATAGDSAKTLGHYFEFKTVAWHETVEGAVYQGFNYALDYYWYYIPASLRKVTVTGDNISERAFANCSMLSEVNLNGEVTCIGRSVFNGCTNLVTVNGLDGVTQVDYRAFYGCAKLTAFPIKPLSLVGAGAFYGCENLTGTLFDETLKEIGGNAFSGTRLASVALPAGLKTIGVEAFYNTPLTSVTVPDSVTSIGEKAFAGCPLEELTLPFVGQSATAGDGARTLGYYFEFKTVAWHETVEGAVYQGYDYGLDYYWYFIPASLKKVTVTGAKLPQNAFMNCTMLEEIVLNGVAQIDAGAFSGCTNLKNIVFDGAPPVLAENALSGLAQTVVIKASEAHLEAYGRLFENYTVTAK